MKNIINSLGVVTLATIVVVSIAYATTGSFTPTGTTPTNTYRTLGDIYSKLINFNLNPSATHSVSTTTSPSGSMYTLGDIYGLLTAENARLIPNNIRNNVTIFGVRGTMVEGTGTGTTLDWTGTIPSVQVINYVSTYQPGFAGGKGLCWSHGQFEIDANHGISCVTRQVPRYPNDQAVGGFYEANPNVGPNGENSIPLGAVEYCDYLNSDGVTVATTPQHYWKLPTQSEIYFKAFEAIISGTSDPISMSRGGFRNEGLFSSELNDVNYYASTPLGIKDSVKTAGLYYSVNLQQATLGTFTRDRKAAFRCVHQN